jgi:hypothetical protein
MISHTDFNKELLLELRKFRVFTLYCDKELESCIPEKLILRLAPSETISFYKSVMKFKLVPKDPASSLVCHTVANCDLTFTSNVARPELAYTPNESEFDFEQAMTCGPRAPGQRIYAVNVVVRLSSPADYSLGALRKRLWNSEPPHVEGIPEYINVLV